MLHYENIVCNKRQLAESVIRLEAVVVMSCEVVFVDHHKRLATGAAVRAESGVPAVDAVFRVAGYRCMRAAVGVDFVSAVF